MIDDEWALLVHTSKNEYDQLAPMTPLSPLGSVNPNLTPPTVWHQRQSSGTFNPQALNALEGKRDFTPRGMDESVNLPSDSLHELHHMNIQSMLAIPERRSSMDARHPATAHAAHLRPPPGRPVSVINPPPTQAPVSCLRRQSLPPQLDGSRRE
jgi:hypothetical protein